MKIIFCDSVIDRKMVEPIYADESTAAKQNGFSIALISHEALVDEGNVRKALSLVKASPEKEVGIYRGWMMAKEDYQRLYEGLLAKNIVLINTADEYANGHLFPESYTLIESYTPKSVIIPQADISKESVLRAALEGLVGGAIVKDYVKSLKHYWEEACYIPEVEDWEKAKGVINRFIEIQGASLQGGLVLREFVKLKKIAEHSKSGMPLSEEYRVFFLNGKLLQLIPYWEEGSYQSEVLIPDKLLDVAKEIESNFFTMDVARVENGDWIIMELGDGQVAGLPDQTDINEFYSKLNWK